ncbi:penicillin-binding protein 1C [Hyphomicrobium sp. CS1BSMeth3]|uniref:penicillin-binding protein 1C n=1 Tax=Hyphomicrobium sp. CS1BSMeth3 TaxID=1892844 RepID=UPI0009F8D75F|nr:penicillin-binding protein 1C [Hyphomicrobium sp. CS1BSMeth3]
MDGERTGADRVHGSSRFRWAYRPACHAFALFRRPPWRRSSQVLTGRRDTGEAPTTGQAPWRRGETSKTQSRGAIVRRSAFGALTAALLIFTPLLALELAARWTVPPSLERAGHTSTIVLDRRDRLLRAFTTPDGIWRLPVAVGDVDRRYLDMLLAFEDRRFRSHGGVDALATLRAGWQFLSHGRIVSGSSTLTMQTARLLSGEHPRTLAGKLEQMVRARQLELKLTKDEILDLYLLLAPFGGNIEGVRAASLAYFGKEPRRLSPGEAALLVALPQSPAMRRPDRNPENARRARDRVLARAMEAGVIKEDEARAALVEAVPTARRAFGMLAPHLAESEVARLPDKRVHRLTLDRDAQTALEQLAREHTEALGSRLSSAVLALDHTTGDILAYVGSADYFDAGRLGANDMVQAVRSPGSTLKPIIYGLAFEGGRAHPETLIEDRPTRFGTYNPKNFDQGFRGTVSIREALGLSLNIPAVQVLSEIGPARLNGRLRRAGLKTELPAGAQPTLAIALGGIGLRLQDLATLYAGLASGGRAMELNYVRGERRTLAKAPPRLLSPVAAWYVTDILKDAPPPANARGGRIAYKTGTSYGYRDAWAVGYDGKHVIAVWIGRADGTATPGLSGHTAAAPLLFDAFARIAEKTTPLPAAPPGAIRATSGTLPPPLRRFGNEAQPQEVATFVEPLVRIAFPPDRAELEHDDGDDAAVMLKAEGGALPLTWLADGAPISSDPQRREVEWRPDGRGFMRITVIDAKGKSDRVDIRLK